MSATRAREWVSALGGRRFLLTLGCGAVTALLCWFGKIGDEVYATVTIATVGAFITGNGFQKWKEADVAAKEREHDSAG